MTATRTSTHRTPTRVAEVMTAEVITVDPDTPFPDLVEVMLSHDISGVPVVAADGSLLGMVTEADVVSKPAYGGRRRRALEAIADLVTGGETRWAIKSKGQTAAQVMSRHVVTASPRESLRAAARRMVELRLKRLPVVEDGRVVGILSRADVLRIMHRDDHLLLADVQALLADPLRAPERLDVVAEVHEGVVTITGTVEFPRDIEVLSATIWHLPGVVDVVNNTTSREPEPGVG